MYKIIIFQTKFCKSNYVHLDSRVPLLFLSLFHLANVNEFIPGETTNNHYSSRSAMRVQINSFSFQQIPNGNSGEKKAEQGKITE